MRRVADLAGQFLSMFGMLTLCVAAKAALFDHEPWTLWVPLLGIGAASLAAMTVLAGYVNRKNRSDG